MKIFRNVNVVRRFRRKLFSLLESSNEQTQTGTFDILRAMISVSYSTLPVLLLGPCASCETEAIQSIQTSSLGEKAELLFISDGSLEKQQRQSESLSAVVLIVGSKGFASWSNLNFALDKPAVVVLCKVGTSALQREKWLTSSYESGYQLSREGHRYVGVRTERGTQPAKT